MTFITPVIYHIGKCHTALTVMVVNVSDARWMVVLQIHVYGSE